MKRAHPAEHVPFHPVEHAIISHYLGVRPPPQARGIDIWAHVEPNPETDGELAEPAPDAPVVLRPPFDEDKPDGSSVENAVARLLLGPIEHRLPQYATFDGQGNATWGRGWGDAKRRAVSVLPREIVSINWADSGPGLSWPETYTLGYLPGYHRYVVISSRDSGEFFGFADLPIRHFSGDADPMYMAKRVVIGEWRRQRKAWGQTHWQDYWSGAIDEEEALRWGRRVWESRDPNDY